MRALYDAIAEVSGNQAVGLMLGSEERPENYSRFVYPGLSAGLMPPSTTREYRRRTSLRCRRRRDPKREQYLDHGTHTDPDLNHDGAYPLLGHQRISEHAALISSLKAPGSF